MDRYDQFPVVPHLLGWDDFVAEFEARWVDPNKEGKAVDKLMMRQVSQHTSVKVYNDTFNELLNLTSLANTSVAVLCTYDAGIKTDVWTAALPALRTNQNMSFHNRQQLMVEMDESLQERCPRQQQQPRFVINNPVIQLPPPRGNFRGASASALCVTAMPQPYSRQSTPVKVEAAWQFTKLTPEEQENLCRAGQCFYCWEQGHMANQCQRRPQHVAVAETTEPTSYAPPQDCDDSLYDTATVSTSTPAPASAVPDFQ
jgi:hypothetical protein